MQQRIVIVGGGPAGLLAARLLARSGFSVKLYERLDPAATYGFGVALAGRALDRLTAVDPEAAERIAALCHPLPRWTMRRDGQAESVEDRGASGVERAGLLRTLQQLAVEAGAQIEAGAAVGPDDVAAEGDVVVFADGLGSRGRDAFAARFGASITPVPIPYIWCGAELDLESMTLDMRQTEHGIFCAHVMPYGGGRCTFQVDTVEASLRSARLRRDGAGTDSDAESLSFLTDVFSPLLGGRGLIGNGSRWSTFRLVTCDTWSHEKFVLLGDAAHTAHYTVGSGTRMAIEDAIVLSEALSGEGTMSAAFASYEAERLPAVQHLQWRANRSQTWWRTLSQRYDLPLAVLLLSYFTRTGSVGLEALARSNPPIVQAALAHLQQPAAVTARPDVGPGLEVPDLDGAALHEALAGRLIRGQELGDDFVAIDCDALEPWSDATLLRAQELRRDRPAGVLLTGGDERRLVLDRFDVSEELRAATGVPVAVRTPSSSVDHAATAIAAGRTDYAVVDA